MTTKRSLHNFGRDLCRREYTCRMGCEKMVKTKIMCFLLYLFCSCHRFLQPCYSTAIHSWQGEMC